jgi:hypothetical protein
VDEDLERRLQALRLERRAQQEELEEVAREADASARTVAEAVRQRGERGDRCVLEVGVHRLVGSVVHVEAELVRIAGFDGQMWDVALDRVSVVAVVEPGRSAHRVSRGHPRSLAARARELVGEGSVVEVGRLDRPDPLRGQVVGVSRTHLELEDAGRRLIIVSWPAVAWLRQP